MSETADKVAAKHMADVRPNWTGLALAQDALNLPDRTLLHAGPPFPDQGNLPLPVLNSAVHAARFEGWAEDATTAGKMIKRGDITLKPAQAHKACAPLAMIISPSMWLQVVEDAASSSRRAFAPINTGNTQPLPHGGSDETAVVKRLHFINHEIAPRLCKALDEPIDLLPIIDASLRGGDECHGMTGVGSGLIRDMLLKRAGSADDVLAEFLDAAPGYFLFLMMAASKVVMMAAEGVKSAAIVTTAGGNGRQFGICLASRPDQWIATECAPPSGTIPDHAKALGAIGDSVVIDALGFGGLALSCAPSLLDVLGDHAPEDVTARHDLLLETTHPALLGGRCRFALNARKVVKTSREPLNVLGILDGEGKDGIIGRGVYSAPVTLFKSALDIIT